MRLTHRLLNTLLRRNAAKQVRVPQPARVRHAFRPFVGLLEPRFVLNATAELNALGQLVISGDEASDTVQLEVDAQDRILIRDAANKIISITGHPGASTDPLERSAITSNQLIIDLGGGDDILRIDIPAGLNVQVLDNAGQDSIHATFLQGPTTAADRTINLAADEIVIDSPGGFVDLRSTMARFAGDVEIGDLSLSTSVLMDNGSITVEGSFALRGDVNLLGSGATLDLSQAELSATNVGSDLRIAYAPNHDSQITLGDASDQNGHAVQHLFIDSADTLNIQAESFELAGRLSINHVSDTVDIRGEITALQVAVEVDASVDVDGSITAVGPISITTSSPLVVTGELDSAITGNLAITLNGRSLVLSEVMIGTSGGRVSVTGPIQVDGDLRVDTGRQQTANRGGEILVNGTIDSRLGTVSDVTFDSRGANGRGAIVLSEAVGSLSPLHSVSLLGNLVSLHSIESLTGGVLIQAVGTSITGNSITTTGDLIVNGTLTWQTQDLRIIADDITIRGNVSGQNDTQSLVATASKKAEFGAGIVGFEDLTIVAGDAATLVGAVDLSGTLIVTGPNPTRVFAPSIQSQGTQRFIGGVTFVESGFLRASDVTLGMITTVEGSKSYMINAPVVGNDLIKAGNGTLILTAANAYTGSTSVNAGSLRIEGSTAVGAGPIHVVGGLLEGNGIIRSVVIARDGSTIDPGPRISSLTVAGLNLASDTSLRFDLEGTIEGQQYDRIVVAGVNQPGIVQLGSAQLVLTFSRPAQVATEYVLIRNDGDDAVIGQFTSTTAPDGTSLATPRILNEGDLVSLDFGQSGRPAFITYAGGDGNDVAIVTAGDVEIAAGDVTLVQRRGSNLEVRTGADLPTAQAASPVIRPIAAINDHQLRIIGANEDQSLFIDFDRFVDPSADAIQFEGNIHFVGGGQDEGDSISFVDLDLTSDDFPLSFHYEIEQADAGTIEVLTRADGTRFNVRFEQTESITQSVYAPIVELQYSDMDEQIEIRSIQQNTGHTSFVSTPSTGGQLSIFIRNPSDRMVVLTGGGDDFVTIDSEGTVLGFDGALHLDGQAGVDEIQIRTELALGKEAVTGNLLIAAETITANQDINTSFGNADGEIRMTGGTLIRLMDGAVVNAGEASVSLDASGGKVDLSEGVVRTQNQLSALLIENASEVHLGDIDVALGQMQITTSQPLGNVFQSLGSEIIVDRLDIHSMGSVLLDSPKNQFRLIEKIIANGDVAIHDSVDGIEIIKIDSRGNDVNLFADNTIQLAAGAIVAEGATVQLTAIDGIFSRSAETNASVANISASNINMTVTRGNIGTASRSVVVAARDSLNSEVATPGSEIYLSSPLIPLPIALISAPLGVVVIDAVSIQDATSVPDTTVADPFDIVTNRLQLNATDGIGSLRQLEIRDVTDFIAITESGGIDIDHFSENDLAIRLLKADSGDIEFKHTGMKTLFVKRVEGGSGDVSIIDENGSLIVQGLLQSASGDVSLSAGKDISLESEGHLQTQSGSVFLLADSGQGNSGGKISMVDGAIVETIEGRVGLVADGDITLASVRSASTLDNAISIESASGEIVDGGDTHIDLIADSGGVQIVSRHGIGDGNGLETTIGRLTAQVIDSGAIELRESTDLEIRSVIANDGAITIQSRGEMIAMNVVSLNTSRQDNVSVGTGHSRDIQLITTESDSDIIIGYIGALNGSDVELVAGDDVFHLNRGGNEIIFADDLRVIAFNGTDDGFISIDLITEVNDLVFTVEGPNPGDVFIAERSSIHLASSDQGGDQDQLVTGNGRITIRATDSIFVTDSNSENDTRELRGDPEIVAGGMRGQVSLSAGNEVHLAGATQIEASLASVNSILITAPAVILGDQVQLTTGSGVGIARWFSPRPAVGITETAFFDFTTVQTNRLEQANANDAQGVLSLLIGRPGENGFTINIDWGDSDNPARRFQQLDNLPGFETFSQSHVYLEGDILNSTLNGRTSATAPLQVRFSVRHHESILVIGDSIQQGTSDTEIVAGRRISSTDNPLTTPLLEVGAASFAIPNLTIPVAFFPVREIIPEVEEQAPFQRVETTSFFVSGTVESKSSSASSTVSRDEYFQIRVLSLEPGDEDLVAPQRLPDDILSGDNLKKLFEELPDGKYEIQYVLGDGNERMLLRFDLRDHQPVVPGADQDGSELRLQAIDPEAILQELQDAVDEPDQSAARSSDQTDFYSDNHSNATDTYDRFSVAGRFISRRRQSP